MCWEATKLMTRFIVIVSSLWWSGSEPTISPRYACILQRGEFYGLWIVSQESLYLKKKKKKRVKTRHETKMTEVKHSGCTHNSVCCQKRKLVWSSFLPTSTCPCFLTLDAALKKFLQNLSVANSEREGTCWKTDQTARWADSSFRTSQHQEGQSWIN